MNRDDKYNRSAKGRARSAVYRSTTRYRNAQRNRILRRRGTPCTRCHRIKAHSRSCLRQYEREYRAA